MRVVRRIAIALGMISSALMAGTITPDVAAAQTVVIRDMGPGRAGRWLRSALAGPHILIHGKNTQLFPQFTVIPFLSFFEHRQVFIKLFLIRK